MKRNNKGFTLAELLIVVAIIAVLVAVAIPTFSGQVEKARVSADLANLRAAYAEAANVYLEGKTVGNATYSDDGKVTISEVVATNKKGLDDDQVGNLSFKVTNPANVKEGKITLEFDFSATPVTATVK